ncbi:Beta-phosphoglucomutase [Spironucleus salmonicida]|uniref:Beta-phosphoglucomutase n=1 Tax=Spironucleus salmonicida TaxID=348837 RepID=V6LSS5_9EUKA|nr:Beta-phosphoglucomutase [Spironucleus salmonicida]|eukprot:EST47655.1 Hydrolase, haloacid dehalogenase-like family protein [Spironucleus salmonicida]
MLPNKEYYIFDFDGTLFNSLAVFGQIDNMIMKKYNISFNRHQYEDRIGGLSIKKFTEFLTKEFKLDVQPQQIYKDRLDAFTAQIKQIQFIDGAIQFLKLLKSQGKKVGIASATDPDYFKIITSTYPELIELTNNTIVTCYEVGKSKPDPSVYLECLNRLGGNINDGIVFEDSYPGIQGAKASGMFVCGIISDKRSFEKKTELCDAYAENFLQFLVQ